MYVKVVAHGCLLENPGAEAAWELLNHLGDGLGVTLMSVGLAFYDVVVQKCVVL